MIHDAKTPVRPLRGQTEFERLMQTVPILPARVSASPRLIGGVFVF